ncbi:MAG TPA: hypothetical protein VMD02_00070 [Candidatus Omnitrophota bacterium]|nr:hypothetical protein [Candidatus Omnitrophota bacterium]
MKKLLLFAPTFIILMMGIALAQEKELVINATSLSYDRDGSRVEARGSVEAEYRDSKMTGEHMVYFSASREAVLDSGFQLAFNSLTFTGRTLNLDLSRETGTATGVSMEYERARINGGQVSFSHQLVKLKNADFSTCGLNPPHYHITASEIDLYQKQAWLVAYWGLFWLGPVPSLPIPVYVYDFKAEQKGKKNVMPYPEAGVNDDDGFWIKETMSWHLQPDLNGNYDISYAARKGVGGGFSLQYQIDEDRESDAGISLNGGEAPSGLLEYRRSFGREIREKHDLLLLPEEIYKQFYVDLKLTRRERINYERVSKTPEIVLGMRRTNLLDGWLEWSATSGSVAEESSGKNLARTNVSATASYPINDGLSAGLDCDATLYGNLTDWAKLMGRLDYANNLGDAVAYDLGYSHYLINHGQGAFNYELYRFNASDKIGLSVYNTSFAGRYVFSCSYTLPDLAPQDIDYTAGLTVHCFNVDLTYRAMRGEFVLGFSLN